MNHFDRCYGALLGLAYGDAISFAALFHRFQDPAIPRRRHDFLWRTNQELDQQGIITLTLPFTHRVPAHVLEPCPTDDTEFALLTLRALVAGPFPPTEESLLAPWLAEVLPVAATVRSSFSERSAIENLRRGVQPPMSGNDNPMHYADAAVPRAVPIGLCYPGEPDAAAATARLDAQITQAEDGVYAAQAMAAAVAVLAGDGSLADALAAGRAQLPPGSWIAHGDALAQACLADAETPEDLSLLLTSRLVNTVYSYGNVAPETLPAAFVIVAATQGDLLRACAVANALPKAADSLAPMVGALCGAWQGPAVISRRWRAALANVRGLCLPFLAGVELEQSARQLAQMVERQR
ncbi:MAG: ADP-ribosylglycohydrolase family protein [Caldilineaceae bacterium]|nr:ADP-ribosylglycohydrolase family protein [Caldilineaceae bacterium]